MLFRSPGGSLDQMAESAYMFGWDDNQLRRSMSTYVQHTDGRLLGQAGQIEQEVRAHAQAQGVRVSDKWIADNAEMIVAGRRTLDDSKRYLNDYAISANPHLADRIRSGETVANIAEPYRQTMAQLLELSPESVTMQDPMVRQALSAKDGKGQIGRASCRVRV